MKNSFARKNARRKIALDNFKVQSYEVFHRMRGIDKEHPLAVHLYAKYVEKKEQEKKTLLARIR